MYAGDDAAWRLAAEAGQFAHIPRITTADAIQSVAKLLRQDFIDWVGERSAENDSLDWWASELAAKSAYTHLFNRICVVSAVLRVMPDLPPSTAVICDTAAVLSTIESEALRRNWPVLVVSGEERSPARRPLRQAFLGGWPRVAPNVVLTFPRRFVATLDSVPAYRRRVLRTLGAEQLADFTGDRTALLFTWVDERNFSATGDFCDPYLDTLVKLLKAEGWRVAYVPRIHGLDFEDLARRLLATGELFFFPELALDVDDWRTCLERAAAWTPRIPSSSCVGDTPIAALALEHIEEYRWSQVQSLSLEPLVESLAAAGVRPARIFHICEGHAWEQTLALAVRRHLPDATIVGYENLNMTRYALSMFPAANEFRVRPLPDRIVTNGPLYHRVLLDYGWPPERVVAGCGLRHRTLLDAPPRTPAPNEPARILVATDASLEQAVELSAKAIAAFGEVAGLKIKAHPLLGSEQLRNALGAGAELFTDEPISILLRSCNLMLYTYSAVCYEALAAGVPPVFVRSETTVDLDQLEPFRDLRWEARTAAELVEVTETILRLGEAELASWSVKARAAVAEAFAPVDAGCIRAFVA